MKRRMRAIVEAGPPPGLIAYAGREPVGWVQVGPRAATPNWNGARRLSAPPDAAEAEDAGVWAINCFFIPRAHRGRGLADALLAWRDARRTDAERRRAAAKGSRGATRLTWLANAVLFGGFAGPVTWTIAVDAPVAYGVMLAFGGVSVGLWLHVVEGIASRRDPGWTLGVAVVAVNFSVWVLALWLLGAASDAAW